jgi:acetoin utilization deacetylase AcuC-like enzyme
MEHDPREHLPEHPDTPERIVAIERALAAEGWLGWERREARAARETELEAVHDRRVIDRVAELCARGGGAIDSDTFVGAASGRAAYHASGGACAMVRALVSGEAPVGFALTRPSGHHAERSRSMGFCLFNNVAVATQLAIAELGVERVFILDFDVHHGNGTAEIFRYRRDVLFASIHQSGIYPGTGALSDTGSGPGLGYTLNLPVSAGAEGDLWLSLLEHVILPAAAEFHPELVLLSAGFDAHRADPIGGCRLESADFAHMTCHVRDVAHQAGAPIGAVLEGGYDLEALPECVISTMRALAGEGEAVLSAPEALYTSRAAAQIGHYWEL